MADQSDFSDMPEILCHVAERLGLPAALRLAAEMGGEEHKIPRKSAGSALERRVGQEIAAVLAEEWAGINVSIPNYHGRVAVERRRRVLTQPTKSTNALARELKITARQVRNLRNGKAADPNQPNLFD